MLGYTVFKQDTLLIFKQDKQFPVISCWVIWNNCYSPASFLSIPIVGEIPDHLFCIYSNGPAPKDFHLELSSVCIFLNLLALDLFGFWKAKHLVYKAEKKGNVGQNLFSSKKQVLAKLMRLVSFSGFVGVIFYRTSLNSSVWVILEWFRIYPFECGYLKC